MAAPLQHMRLYLPGEPGPGERLTPPEIEALRQDLKDSLALLKAMRRCANGGPPLTEEESEMLEQKERQARQR